MAAACLRAGPIVEMIVYFSLILMTIAFSVSADAYDNYLGLSVSVAWPRMTSFSR